MENYTGEIDLSKRREIREQSATPELRQHRGFYWTRLFLRCASLGLCIAIIVALCKDLRWFSDSKDVKKPFKDGSGEYPVWPEDLKVWPIYLLLASACIAGLVSLVMVVASFNKNVRRMTHIGNIATIIVSTSCLLIWTGVVAYYGTWDTKNTNWDLMSWTCTHRDLPDEYKEFGFDKFCFAFRFSFWAGVTLAAIEALNLILFVAWWLTTRRSREYVVVEDA